MISYVIDNKKIKARIYLDLVIIDVNIILLSVRIILCR